jgi:hypothetical protein
MFGGFLPPTFCLPTSHTRKVHGPKRGPYVKTRLPLIQVTFRSFSCDDASQLHSFLKLCCSSLIDQISVIRQSLARRRVFQGRSVGQPQFGPELRGQVRLIKVLRSQRRALAAVLPVLYPAEGLRESKYRQGGPAATSDSKPLAPPLRPNPQIQGDERNSTYPPRPSSTSSRIYFSSQRRILRD